MYGGSSGLGTVTGVATPMVTGGTIAGQLAGIHVTSLPLTGSGPITAASHPGWVFATAITMLAVWTLVTAVRVLPRLLPKHEV